MSVARPRTQAHVPSRSRLAALGDAGSTHANPKVGSFAMQDAQQQLLAVQSEAAQVAKAKAMMEVETMRIHQRIELGPSEV